MIEARLVSWHDEAILQQWQDFGSQTNVTPFQLPNYLRVYSNHFVTSGEVVLLGFFEGEKLIAIGSFHQIDQTLKLLGMQPVLGQQEITDYGDIVIDHSLPPSELSVLWELCKTWAVGRNIRTIQLDYVREMSPSWSLWSGGKFGASIQPQEVAPIIMLPTDWQTYVQSLPKKKRDELKRKLKRLDTASPSFEFDVLPTDQTIADFIRLHRLSDPAKEQFMSAQMAAFFNQLAITQFEGGWQWYFAFLSVAGERAAAVGYFQRKNDGILLYNSGYDPAHMYLGVGFGLQAHLIKHAITSNLRYFDFLRGGERYKLDLGAVPQQLWQVCIPLVD